MGDAPGIPQEADASRVTLERLISTHSGLHLGGHPNFDFENFNFLLTL
jgi:hypothetical protein